MTKTDSSGRLSLAAPITSAFVSIPGARTWSGKGVRLRAEAPIVVNYDDSRLRQLPRSRYSYIDPSLGSPDFLISETGRKLWTPFGLTFEKPVSTGEILATGLYLSLRPADLAEMESLDRLLRSRGPDRLGASFCGSLNGCGYYADVSSVIVDVYGVQLRRCSLGRYWDRHYTFFFVDRVRRGQTSFIP